MAEDNESNPRGGELHIERRPQPAPRAAAADATIRTWCPSCCANTEVRSAGMTCTGCGGDVRRQESRPRQ